MNEADFNLRLVEALLFASPDPLDSPTIGSRLPEGTDVAAILSELVDRYGSRGVNLMQIGGKWQFRTAPDLGAHLRVQVEVKRKLSRASLETLAIIAYHQPVTRAEIEQIRGVSLSRGTLDLLLEAGWIRPRGHRDAPGKPALWVTTEGFLSHFNLGSLDDLPGVAELKATGLLEARALPGVEAITGEDDVEGGRDDDEPADGDDVPSRTG